MQYVKMTDRSPAAKKIGLEILQKKKTLKLKTHVK